MVRKKLLDFLKIYLEVNIKLIYYVTEIWWLYLIYIFISAYGLFGPVIEGGNITRLVCFILTFHLVLNTSALFFVCKAERSRKFLIDLIGEKFIIKYLGEFTVTIRIQRVMKPVLGLLGIEYGSELITRNGMIMQMEANRILYEQTEGKRISEMSQELKDAHLRDCLAIQQNTPRGGLISRSMENTHSPNVSRETFPGMRDIVFGDKNK